MFEGAISFGLIKSIQIVKYTTHKLNVLSQSICLTLE